MKRFAVIASVAALFATSLNAGPIEDREALMKALGKAVGSVAPIAKGEKEFDAGAVLAALQEIDAQAQKLDVAALFPEGSTNDQSEAAPKIWEDPASFQAAVDKFKADAAAAVAAAPADLDAFRAQFGAVTQNCGGCHQDFRLKKG